MLTSTSRQELLQQAVRLMTTLSSVYQLDLWPDQDGKDRLHDLSIMDQHQDLVWIATDLLTRDQSILMRYSLDFSRKAGIASPDSVTSDAWPIVDRDQVAHGRFVVLRHGRQRSYESQLHFQWPDVADVPLRDGDTYHSEQMSGSFHVGKENRRELIVRQTGSLHFAFAEDVQLQTKVFLPMKHAPDQMQFVVDQRLTAIVVSTTKGLQARAIRA